jgi:hypothetical protein
MFPEVLVRSSARLLRLAVQLLCVLVACLACSPSVYALCSIPETLMIPARGRQQDRVNGEHSCPHHAAADGQDAMGGVHVFAAPRSPGALRARDGPGPLPPGAAAGPGERPQLSSVTFRLLKGWGSESNRPALISWQLYGGTSA